MAVLALLSIDRWTPVTCSDMKRSTIHFIWPRAESKMYEELKRLAAAGYAKATAIGRTLAGRATRRAPPGACALWATGSPNLATVSSSSQREH